MFCFPVTWHAQICKKKKKKQELEKHPNRQLSEWMRETAFSWPDAARLAYLFPVSLLGFYSLFTVARYTHTVSVSPAPVSRRATALRWREPTITCSLRVCQPSVRRAAQQVTVRNALNPPLNPLRSGSEKQSPRVTLLHAFFLKSLF